MHFEIQKIVRDDGDVGVAMFANYAVARDDKVQRCPLAVNWGMDGSKFIEKLWFAWFTLLAY